MVLGGRVYPALTYRDVRAALTWLADAFGFEGHLLADGGAMVTCRDVVVPCVRSGRSKGRFVVPGGYGVGVSAAADNPFYESPVPALPPDTTPAAIRDALIDEERAEFERTYQEAMLEAARTLDLTRVLNVLRNYHRIAWLTQRQGPEAHRRMLDKAAEIMRTGKNPDAVPAQDVMALIAKRRGQ